MCLDLNIWWNTSTFVSISLFKLQVQRQGNVSNNIFLWWKSVKIIGLFFMNLLKCLYSYWLFSYKHRWKYNRQTTTTSKYMKSLSLLICQKHQSRLHWDINLSRRGILIAKQRHHVISLCLMWLSIGVHGANNKPFILLLLSWVHVNSNQRHLGQHDKKKRVSHLWIIFLMKNLVALGCNRIIVLVEEQWRTSSLTPKALHNTAED